MTGRRASGREVLLEQVLCHHDALDLVGTLVDLGVLAKRSTPSIKPLFVRKYVRRVHPDEGVSSH